MNILQLLKRVRAIIARDRDAFFHTVVNMASGKVIDEDDRNTLKEFDQVLAELNIIIYSMEPADGVQQAVDGAYRKGAQS